MEVDKTESGMLTDDCDSPNASESFLGFESVGTSNVTCTLMEIRKIIDSLHQEPIHSAKVGSALIIKTNKIKRNSGSVETDVIKNKKTKVGDKREVLSPASFVKTSEVEKDVTQLKEEEITQENIEVTKHKKEVGVQRKDVIEERKDTPKPKKEVIQETKKVETGDTVSDKNVEPEAKPVNKTTACDADIMDSNLSPLVVPDIKEDTCASVSLTSSATKAGKRRSEVFNRFAPAYRMPFKYGWKRLVVYRNPPSEGNKRQQKDIYYYTPDGKSKLRSGNEIIDYLTTRKITSLSCENFTFFKEPLTDGNEPDKEIIRDAKAVGRGQKDIMLDTPPLKVEIIESPSQVVEVTPKKIPVRIIRSKKKDNFKDSPKTLIKLEESPPKPDSPTKSEPPAKLDTSGVSPLPPETSPQAIIIKSKLQKKKKVEYQPPVDLFKPDTLNQTVVRKSDLKIGKKVKPEPIAPIKLIPSEAVKQDDAEIKDVKTDTKVPEKTAAKQVTMKIVSKKIKIDELPDDDKNLTKKPFKVKKTVKLLPKPKYKETIGNSEEFVIGTLPPGWSPTSSSKSTAGNSQSTVPVSPKVNSGREVCSITCPLALGKVPTLQCSSCVCLFHFECFGLKNIDKPIQGFVCKNCRENRSKTTVKGNQVPKTSSVTPDVSSTVDVTKESQATTSVSTTSSTTTKPQKIVDGVTTWLPSSSSIKIATSSVKNSTPSTDTTSPTASTNDIGQSLVEIDGKRYVAVAKQSIMSITPNSDVPKENVSFAIQDNHVVTTKKSSDDQINQTPVSVTTSDSKSASTVSAISSEVVISKSNSSIRHSISTNSNSNSSNSNSVSSVSSSSTGVVLVPCSPSRRSDNIMVNDSTYLIRTKDPVDFEEENIPPNSTMSFSDEESISADDSQGVLEDDVLTSPEDIDENLTRQKLKRKQPPEPNDFSTIYKFLVDCLSYLKVEELLKVARTNKFFYRVSTDRALWHTVKLKNSRVYDWESCVKTLRRQGTRVLDLRKMIFPSKPDEVGIMWSNFVRAIPNAVFLEQIDLCRCNTAVVDTIALVCLTLRVLNALYISSGYLSFENIAHLNNLKELRIRGIASIACDGPLKFANNCEQITVLSLTNMKNLDVRKLEVVAQMASLETLELGDCGDILKYTSMLEILSELQNLKNLRFEKVVDAQPHYHFLKLISEFENLTSLELINIEVKPGFDNALSRCKNLEKLLLIPLYTTQLSVTNRLVINGVTGLSTSLKYFVWGLTTELFKMTTMFMENHGLEVDISKNSTAGNKKLIDGHIPVLKSNVKPVSEPSEESTTMPTQIDLFTSQKLETVLNLILLNTEVKLLKIPFTATWRQNLSDCIRKG